MSSEVSGCMRSEVRGDLSIYPRGSPVQLAKVDVETGTHLEWTEDNCFPSEPVFVASPDAVAEDDGKNQRGGVRELTGGNRAS